MSMLCSLSAEKEAKINEELRNTFETIIKVNSFIGAFSIYGESASEGYNSEISLFFSYSIFNRENRSVIDTRSVQYVKSMPLNVLDRIELNDDLVQGMLQDAYRDISELVVDSLLSIE